MKIIKRKLARPLNTSILFIFPTIMFVGQKIAGLISHREYLWWITIPSLFILWLFINFKITKT